MSGAFISVLKNPGEMPFTWMFERRELHRQRTRQHPQRALARRVGNDVRAPEVGGERADVDDLAAPSRLHRRQERTRDEERAVEIRRHQRPPFGRRELLEILAVIHRGVVDEDVDRSQAALDVGDARRNGVRIGHVERRDAASMPSAASASRGLGELVEVAAVEHDLRRRRGPAPAQSQDRAPSRRR